MEQACRPSIRTLHHKSEIFWKRRNKIKRGIIDNKDKDIRKVINKEADTGETRQGLVIHRPARFDKVIVALHKNYQWFYQQYKKKTGKPR